MCYPEPCSLPWLISFGSGLRFTDHQAHARLVVCCTISSRHRATEAVDDLSDSTDLVISLR